MDVGTGFGLWLTELPLLVIGHVADKIVNEPPIGPVVYGIEAVLMVSVSAVVVVFLLLMREGYRWARTLLTGGAITSVVYVVAGLFSSVPRPPWAAVTYAVTGIVGGVLILGGMYVLHRKDAHAYFTR